jgi:hypothetical protein
MRFLTSFDFGQGFYTTTLLRPAITWAHTRAAVVGGVPGYARFVVDRNALSEQDTLSFLRGSFDAEDLWSLVFYCRGGNPGHNRGEKVFHDVVIGPVAAFWRQRLAIQDVDQISFHTDRAVYLLNTLPASKKGFFQC